MGTLRMHTSPGACAAKWGLVTNLPSIRQKHKLLGGIPGNYFPDKKERVSDSRQICPKFSFFFLKPRMKTEFLEVDGVAIFVMKKTRSTV